MDDLELSPPYRHASPDDAPVLAELVNIAGEGLPHYLWTKIAGRDGSPWDVGQQRAQRDTGGFSYRNAVLKEEGGSPIAALIGYPLSDQPETIDYDSMPAMFVPLQELENLACGSWYINVLATLPEHRGRGHGAGLLEVAQRLALHTKRNGLSLIVSDANHGARRLYKRQGYSEVATRPMVKESWENPGTNWVLLMKKP